MFRIFASLAVLAAVVPLARDAAALDLVRDGRPAATIVSAVQSEPDAGPARKARGGKRNRPAVKGDEADERLAVEILRDWIKKMTDAELPVATAAPDNGPAIYVGKAAVKAGLKLDDIQSPSDEGLRITADGRCVLVAGQNGTATVKAVCRFLEQLGCRYLMDGPLGEVYPRSRDLAVGPLAITEKPGLLFRNPKGPSWRGGYWCIWNGAGGEPINHAHAWGHYVAPAEFAKHPEYFAMGADGQRRAGGWLCTSNEKLREHFADGVIATIKGGRKHPSLSPTDGRGYCQCPACRAQDDPKVVEPSTGLVAVSNRYADFFDFVGRRVAPAAPDSLLSFYCYADYTQPPTLDRRLSPNLCAVIAPIRYCRLHAIGDPNCPSRAQQVGMVEGWTKISGHLGYYNYMYNLADATLPLFKFTACKKEYPYLADQGLTAMTMEVLSNWHIYGPHIYLGLRLAYDPHANADAIMDDYWLKFYGPAAAAPMKAYWMGIDEAVTRYRGHSGSFFGLQEVYSPEFIAVCRSRLDAAAKAAKGDRVYSERVALAAEGLQSAVEHRRICDEMSRGEFQQALATYQQLTGRLEDLAAKRYANPEYATAYLRRMLQKTVERGAAATAAPNKVLQVLPDQWLMTYDDDDQGEARGLHRIDADTSGWKRVATWSRTLSSQGLRELSVLWYRTSFRVPERHGRLAIFFGEVDGTADVYVNGTRIPVTDGATPPAAKAGSGRLDLREGQARRRTPFEVDVTAAVHPGENVVVVRADNRKISELFLGGIVRPAVVVEQAAGRSEREVGGGK